MASSLTAVLCAITWASGAVLTLPAAITEAEQRVGLSGQTETDSMAFVWDSAERRPVWMRDTSIALSAGWIDNAGTLTEIMELDPFDETIRWSQEPARIMIEMPAGEFEAAGIRVGDHIESLDCKQAEERP